MANGLPEKPIFHLISKLTLILSLVGVMQMSYAKSDVAIFAGGCFWCVEADFDHLVGVIKTESGYDGGTQSNPTYDLVSSGNTQYAESVRVTYNPKLVSYQQLVDFFLQHIDPTVQDRQFCDIGPQYRSAIFYLNDEQKRIAEARIAYIRSFFPEVYTKVVPSTQFYVAEDYHQNYHQNHALKYKYYRYSCGRDARVKSVWEGKSMDNNIKKLSKLQYQVTQEGATERAFDNAYWDNKAQGIYVDVVSGEPLFSSNDKFDSGTGWPSFTKPIHADAVVYKADNSLFTSRIEVLSKSANSHLGHVFDDGPEPTGKRYCINSAALRFVPKAELKEAGYAQFIDLFN